MCKFNGYSLERFPSKYLVNYYTITDLFGKNYTIHLTDECYIKSKECEDFLNERLQEYINLKIDNLNR